MALTEDILKLLKAEGYRINEPIKDALDDFISIIEEEMESLDDDLEDDEDDDDDDDD
jgi:hypothetical protein